MKIVIVEDEELIAEDLSVTLRQIDPEVTIEAVLSSVQQALEYFGSGEHPDLIFSDIQLGDGLSFEIFQKMDLKIPIIFCTAYDSYAIDAFQTNGIDYILKPYEQKVIEKAMQKYRNLKSLLAKEIIIKYEEISKTLENYRIPQSTTFMIRYRDRLIPVALDKIAIFYVENEVNHLQLFSGQIYIIPETLEETEKLISDSFFRANRQFLIHRNAVREAVEHFPRKMKLMLNIAFEKEIIVSKEKKPKLIQWLNVL